MESWATNLSINPPIFMSASRRTISHGPFFRALQLPNGDNLIKFGKTKASSRWTRLLRSNERFSSMEVRASEKKREDDNPGSSEGKDQPKDDLEGIIPSHETRKPDDSVHKSHHTLSQWREVRAALVAQEKKLLGNADDSSYETTLNEYPRRNGQKWAHPLSMPETGCVLVATEKLDGVRSFERTVVLLLRLGTKDPKDGPFGVIINRPLQRKIRHMHLTDPNLATTFADCSLHFGGPLDTLMFLMRTNEESQVLNLEQFIPGVHYGSLNSLGQAAALVKKGIAKPEDFNFFVGYAGWQLDQLMDEIESEYWVVASCSASLIGQAAADPASDLWEEVLQLMGGQYSELSRKPKQDSF